MYCQCCLVFLQSPCRTLSNISVPTIVMEDTIVGDEDVHVDERYIFRIYTWLVCKYCIQLCITPACVNCVYTMLFYFSTLDVSAT